jgi:hypothetical protein
LPVQPPVLADGATSHSYRYRYINAPDKSPVPAKHMRASVHMRTRHLAAQRTATATIGYVTKPRLPASMKHAATIRKRVGVETAAHPCTAPALRSEHAATPDTTALAPQCVTAALGAPQHTLTPSHCCAAALHPMLTAPGAALQCCCTPLTAAAADHVRSSATQAATMHAGQLGSHAGRQQPCRQGS